jgi:hypothetical protein
VADPAITNKGATSATAPRHQKLDRGMGGEATAAPRASESRSYPPLRTE